MPETITVEDPTIVESVPKDAKTDDSEADTDTPTELSELTFELSGVEQTISVGDEFVAPDGQVVGEIKAIVQVNQDTSKRIHTHDTIHWITLDYGAGEYWEGDDSSGKLPLGEAARQIADLEMKVA
jgi:hypothetical protein